MTSKAGLTYSYTDTLHRHAVIALSDGSVYQYDRNGNMTTRIEGSVTYTQAWDIQNRLTQVVSGSQVSRYEYDADGRMVKKVESTGVTLYVSEDYEVIWSTPPVTATSTYTHKLYFPMMATTPGCRRTTPWCGSRIGLVPQSFLRFHRHAVVKCYWSRDAVNLNTNFVK